MGDGTWNNTNYTSTTNNASLPIALFPQATLLGVPCIHVPSSLGPQGLPLGVQVVGARGSDLETLRCAHWIEAVLAVRSISPADRNASS